MASAAIDTSFADMSIDYGSGGGGGPGGVGETTSQSILPLSRHSAGPNNPSSANAGPHADIWTQILLSVQTARSTPVCPVLILGEPQSGKSTLIRGLAEGCRSGYIEVGSGLNEGDEGADEEEQAVGTPGQANGSAQANGSGAEGQQQSSSRKGKEDLGLAYAYCDVPDEEGEDTLARLSLFTLSSSNDALLPLLPYALRSHSASPSQQQQRPALSALRRSLFLITLDWQRPQAFLDELRTWIAVIRETVQAAVLDGSAAAGDEQRTRRAQEAFLEEMKEAVEAHVRAYVPPGGNAGAGAGAGASNGDGTTAATAGGEGESDGTNAPAASAPAIVPVSAPLSLGGQGSGKGASLSLPLGEGILEDNLGVGIVVVLTKSDTLPKLERDRDFKEEQFDYIQQVLRTICLKYGAALFSTAQSRPASFAVLRQYLLHRLLVPDSSSADATSGAAAAGTASRLPFTHPPSTIERDVLLVPAGWDTWGKILALRDGFSPQLTSAGWDFDVLVESRRRARALPKTPAVMDELERALREEEPDEAERGGSAVRLWEDVVGEWEGARPRDNNAGKVQPPDAQAFLANHYATLQKDAPPLDPRAKFARVNSQNQAQAQAALAATSASGAAGAAAEDGDLPGRSIVGPMQSASLSGPGVEKALGLAQRDDREREPFDLSSGGGSGSGGAAADEGAVGAGTAAGGSARPKGSRRDSRDFRPSAAAPTSSGTPRAHHGLGPGTPQARGVGVGGGGDLRPSSRPHSPMIGGGDRSGGGSGRDSPLASPGATKQSEVLQSFFQDLLRGKSSGTPGGSGSGGAASGGSGAGGAGPRSPHLGGGRG